MSKDEIRWIEEWIGIEPELPKKKHRRPKVNEEWRRKWELWVKDQHEIFGKLLSDKKEN